MKLFNFKPKPSSLALFFGLFSLLVFGFYPNPFPLTSDECFSLYHAQFPISIIWRELSKGNNPPLFETILHFWIQWFGNSEISARSLSLILVSIASGCLWYLGYYLYKSRSIATGIGLFFIGSNTVFLFAQETRAYGLFLLLTIVVQGLWLIPNKTVFQKILWSIFATALLYTHFFGIWVLAIQAFFDGFNYFRNRKTNRSLISFWPWLIILGFYLPYLRVLAVRFMDSATSGTWMESAPWSALYFTLWKFANLPLAVIPTLLLLGICLYYIIKQSENETYKFIYVFLSFAFPFIAMWLISLPSPISIPMFNERYASFVIPSLALILPYSLYRSQHNPIASKACLFLGSIILVVEYSGRKHTVNQNIDVLPIVKSMKSNGTAVILEPDHAAFQWLYYTNPKKFNEWRADSIYHHMAQQLIQDQVYILKTKRSLDSFGLTSKDSLYYVHLDNRKTTHTQAIESQIKSYFRSISPILHNQKQSKTTEFWKLK